MPRKCNRMSWSSRLFQKQAKYYTSATVTTWPAATRMSGLSHVGRPQVTAKRDAGIQRIWHVSGRRVCVRACVCRGWQWERVCDPTRCRRVILFTRCNSRLGSLAPDTHFQQTSWACVLTSSILPLLAILSFFPTRSSSHHITLPPFHFSPSLISP